MADDSTHPKQSGRVTVTHGRNGWEVSEERDNRVIRRMSYKDWHRVERAVGVLALAGHLDVPPGVPDHRTDTARLVDSDD